MEILEETSNAEDRERCELCVEERRGAELLSCNGVVPHCFCVPCVQKKISLDAGDQATACLMESCGGVFTSERKDGALRDASGRVARRLEREKKRTHESGLKGFWRCPYCYELGTGGPLTGGMNFHCGNEFCQWWSCVSCGEGAHERVACGEEHVARTREADSKAPLCPVCGQRGRRGRSGSNLIMCGCGQVALCGACGQDVTSSGYSHFSPYLEWEGEEDERYANLCRLFERDSSRRGWT